MLTHGDILVNKTIRTLVLTAAITLILGIGTSVAADMKPRETSSEQLADARRETQILTSFGMNRYLNGFDLAADVDGNKAVLAGKVDDVIAKDLAERVALSVDGIGRVENRIIIDAGYVQHPQTGGYRSFGEKVEDATITASVKSKLLSNSQTSGLDIHVDTNNGKVILTGHAGSEAEKDLAARITSGTSGVVGLNNQIAVVDKLMLNGSKKAEARADQPMTDSWITSRVKVSLMFTRGVDGYDITVTTVQGAVSLRGVVDSIAERELALRVSQDVRGVISVNGDSLTVATPLPRLAGAL